MDLSMELTKGSRSTVFERLAYLRDLLWVLIQRDLKLRYRRSILGIAWSLLNPLAQLVIFSFVFRYVLPLNIPNYTAFLFTGLLAWNWFQGALFSGTGTITDSRELVKRPGFSLGVLPVVIVSTHFIHYLLALPILLGFLVWSGVGLSAAALMLPVVFLVQFLLTVGLVYFLAVIHVTFRDTQYLLGIFLMLGFYVSPVLYDISAVPDRFRFIYQANPIAILIDAYRDILLRGELPPVGPLAGLGLLALALIWLGHRLFSRSSSNFAEEL
jgi:lipopolysaccharide transport system permease protein